MSDTTHCTNHRLPMQNCPGCEAAQRESSFAALSGSDVRNEPCDECGVNTLALMKERDLLNNLVADLMYRADLFSYLCWLEEKQQHERVPEADFLCLASDGVTCWGKSYAEAVKVAMEHDKQLHDYNQQRENLWQKRNTKSNLKQN